MLLCIVTVNSYFGVASYDICYLLLYYISYYYSTLGRYWRIKKDRHYGNVADSSRCQKMSERAEDTVKVRWLPNAALWDSLPGQRQTWIASSRQLNEQIYRRIQSSVYSHGSLPKHVCYAELTTLQNSTHHTHTHTHTASSVAWLLLLLPSIR